MLTLLLTAALAGPTYPLAESSCALAGHQAAVSCTKGTCVLEESLTYYKPDCRGVISVDSPENVDPLVLSSGTWHVAVPCSEGRCIDDVPNHVVIRRVLTMGLDGGLTLRGAATVSVGPGLTRTGSDALHELKGKPPKRAPKVATLPEATEAVARTPLFGGPLEDGLRHGIWLAPDPDGRPLVREITYARGVRTATGTWMARTRIDAEGRSVPVPELADCPPGTTFDTVLGEQLTQSCAWTDEDGQHAIVASFDLEPWRLRSLERVRNGRRSGPTEFYDPEGRLLKREEYAGGKLVGISETYHPEGTLHERIDRRPDGSIRARERYASNGILLERIESEVPGMGDQEWRETYDITGRLTEARIPLSAARAEVRTWTGTSFERRVDEREWQPPETGCRADLDCPGADPRKASEKYLVGMCDAGVCTKVLDPARRLKDMRVHLLHDTTELERALAEAIGNGRQAWINPNLTRSDAHTCIEVAISRSKRLEDDAPLAARTTETRRVERDVEVIRWAEADLSRGQLAVRDRAAIEGKDGLEPWPAPQRPSPTLALSKVDAKGAHYHLEVFDLEARCAPARSYVPCPSEPGVAPSAWRACDGTELVVREYSRHPVEPFRARAPGDIEACEAACPVSHCEAEAARLEWRFRQRPFQRPHEEAYTLWWSAEDCARSIGL